MTTFQTFRVDTRFRLFLKLALASLLLVGCGNSDDFVFTQPVNQAATGNLTFNFVKAQDTTLEVPTETTRLVFQLYTGENGTGTLDSTVDLPFATTITLEEVDPDVNSVVITAYSTAGVPLSRTTVNVDVVRGLDVTVDVSGATTVTPTFEELTVGPATTTLDVTESVQVVVVADFSTGDQVTLTGNTTVGLTYTPDNNDIVTVTDSGVVTAQLPGSTDIDVSVTLNGTTQTETISVTVNGGDSSATDFDSDEGFALGSINGQQGWSATNANIDQEIVDTSDFRTGAAFANFGARALRVSNDVASGGFGDQIIAPLSDDSVGQADAVTETFTEDERFNRYELKFDFASTTDTFQDGLRVTMSPDLGNGGRMSFIALRDDTDGLYVEFFDTNAVGNFVSEVVAEDLDRSVPHSVRLVFTAIDGLNGDNTGNDTVEIYVDNQLVHTGTSWETYWYFNPEVNNNLPHLPRVVKTLLIRMNQASTADTDGQGFLISNLSQGFYDVTP